MAKKKITIEDAYEGILRAFESPDQQFDELGDDDKNDIDKNFEENKGDAEGKSFAEWNKVKEDDSIDGEAFAEEDDLGILETQATNPTDNYSYTVEDVILPVDDDIEPDDIPEVGATEPEELQEKDLAEIEALMDEQQNGIQAVKHVDESFSEEDIENVNKAFAEDFGDYETTKDFNADRAGIAKNTPAWKDVDNPDKGGFDDGDILAGNALTKIGQDQEPNKELGDRRVQLSKELAALEAEASEDWIDLGNLPDEIVIIDQDNMSDAEKDLRLSYQQNQNIPISDNPMNQLGDTSDDDSGQEKFVKEAKESSEKKNHNDLVELHTESVEDNDGLNKSDNQAGNVFTCPECGFKTISKDEFSDHDLSHSNIPATVDSPESFSEEKIGQPNNDHAILSRFRND
jgi:hypothetical protein